MSNTALILGGVIFVGVLFLVWVVMRVNKEAKDIKGKKFKMRGGLT